MTELFFRLIRFSIVEFSGLGIAAAICNTTDTFKLNLLSVGTYFFNLTLTTGDGGPDCKSGIIASANETVIINVLSSVGIEEQTTNKELLKVTDLLGIATNATNQLLFYIYNDGTVEKRIVIE